MNELLIKTNVAAAKKAAQDHGAVLCAVIKTRTNEEVDFAIRECGVAVVGENRVQELLTKLPALRDSFRIHLIGRLQRNKVKQIVGDVCMIQSVDSEPLAMEIHNRALAAGRRMPVLVEISPAGEEQKGGVPFEETEAFLKKIAPLEGLEIRGLMAVMPLTEDREYLDGLFARTRELFDRLKDRNLNGAAMEELSMGMSGDYQLAAAHGATMVRVGSAIFGPRG